MDPERLATLRHRGIKADADTIAASLQGTWREEHLFALEQAMQRYDFLTQQIDDCEVRVMAEIERLTPPDDPPDGGAPDPAPGTISETASSRSANAATNDTGREGIQPLALRKMMGVDLTAIPTVGPGTALVIASEIGPDFSAFPSAQHFCSWLALAPGTRISGGKNLPGKSPKAVNPVGQALRMAAMAARRSQTFIGAKHRARLARMDTPVAIKATARELACLIYLMVTEGQEYVEQGIGAYEKRRLNRKFAHLDRQAQKLGFQLVPKNARRGKTEPNAVNRLGICYSRELFPRLESELGPMGERYELFVAVLELVRVEALLPYFRGQVGRPEEDRAALARAFIAKAVFDIPTTRGLIERLEVDGRLCRLCGWSGAGRLPSEATFSRAFSEFAESGLASRLHETLIARTMDGHLVEHISRDATAIEAREKPSPKPKAAKPKRRKRGRPRKGEARAKEPSRLERQLTMSLPQMLADLPRACDVGSKRNAKGHTTSWIVYGTPPVMQAVL